VDAHKLRDAESVIQSYIIDDIYNADSINYGMGI
jgi:hypothetical protein